MISLDVTVSVGAGTLEVDGFIPTTQSAQLVFKNFATYVDDDTRVRLLVNGDLVSESGAFTKGQLDATCVVPTGTSEIKALECACEGPAQIGVQIVVADCTGGIETVTGRGVMLFNWEEQQARSGGGSQTVVGDVASVNGKKGTVVLSASDVGALPSNGVADYAEKLKNKTTSETAEIGKDDDNATRIVVKDSSGEKVGDVAYMDDVEDAVSAAVIGINEELDDKQDKLTAGNNITIVGNVISATGGGGSGTVKSVNSQSPDANGNVALTAAQVGALAANGTAAKSAKSDHISDEETSNRLDVEVIDGVARPVVTQYDDEGLGTQRNVALVSDVPTTASDIGALAEDGTAAKAEVLRNGATWHEAEIIHDDASVARVTVYDRSLSDTGTVVGRCAFTSDLETKADQANLALAYGVDPDDATKTKTKYAKGEYATKNGFLWESLDDDNTEVPGAVTTDSAKWKKVRWDDPDYHIRLDPDTRVLSVYDKEGTKQWDELGLIDYDLLEDGTRTQIVAHAMNKLVLTQLSGTTIKLPPAIDNGREDDEDDGEGGTVNARVRKVRDFMIDVTVADSVRALFSEFSESTTYASGDKVKVTSGTDGSVTYYTCGSAGHSAGAWDASHFTKVEGATFNIKEYDEYAVNFVFQDKNDTVASLTTIPLDQGIHLITGMLELPLDSDGTPVFEFHSKVQYDM